MNRVCVKYRLFPTKKQVKDLEVTLETCRLVYNSFINDRVFQYETAKASPSRFTQQKMLPGWSKSFPEVRLVHSQVLQNVAVRVDLAFRAFFQRIKEGKTPGFPRLKGEGQYDSITYPQVGFKISTSFIRLFLQGKQVQIKASIHKIIVGKVKTCTVRRWANKWFVCFDVEQEDNLLPASAESIGIDVGLNSFMALSNGEFIENPRFFRKDEKALAKAGRKQAKAKKASFERKKANKVLARIHERIKNRRHNFIHQETRKLVNRFGLIAVEKLNVQSMLGTHNLAKSISDASWTMFRQVLTYKAESAGRKLVTVNPAYTSQDCSGCGYRPDGKEGRTKKKLSDRWHHCPMCGLRVDRDTNAATNILALVV